MKLLDIPFNDRRRRYLMFHPVNIPDRLRLASTSTTQAFEAAGSSRFYTSQDQRILAKVVPDKFFKRRAPLKWLLRDYLEKRWLGQSDARKEYQSLQVLRRAGLQTPDCLGWGISLNPGNRNASLLLMANIKNAVPGGEHFVKLDEPAKQVFLKQFSGEVLAVARLGFSHRDLHFNNLLVTPGGNIIWIDAHLKRLARSKESQWDNIARSLTARKLYGEAYHQYVHDWLKANW